MNRIVLVNPPYLFWSPEKAFLRPFIGTLPSLGLLSLAGVLRERGYGVKIVESASWGWSISKTVENILRENPRYVGLSCSTASAHPAAMIAEGIKTRNREIITFAGGPHLTALPQETLRRYPALDYGIVGEGERAILNLVEALERGQDLRMIESAAFREGEEVIVNPRCKFIENLDRLPFPAYDLLLAYPQSYRPPFLNYLRGPTASLVSSRGCPQVCTFCDRSVFGNRYRYFSEDYLGELIFYLRRQYQIRHLIFADDQFAASPTRLIRLCEKITSKNFGLFWNCDARVDSMNWDLLKIMKRAGCWMISYGIESGSQKILDQIQKGIHLEQVDSIIRLTKKAGIRAKGHFMIGYPEETPETLRQTLALILNSPFDEINLSFLTPYPGTQLYERMRHSPGFTEDWSRMNAMNLLLTPQALSRKDLDEAFGKILRQFYMRPRVTFSYLSILSRSPENGGRLLAGLCQWFLSR